MILLMTMRFQAQCFGLEIPRSRIVLAVMAYSLLKATELYLRSGSFRIALEMRIYGHGTYKGSALRRNC